MEKHIAHARASENESSLTVVEMFRRLEKDVHNIVSSQSALDGGPLDNGRVNSFSDVLLLFYVDAAPDRNSSIVPTCD